MLHEVEYQRQHHGDDKQKLHRHDNVVLLGRDAFADHRETLGVAAQSQHAQTLQYAHRHDNPYCMRHEHSQPDGISGDDIDEAEEGTAVAQTAPQPCILLVEIRGEPYAHTHLHGEEHEGEKVDPPQPPFGRRRHIKSRQVNLGSAQQNHEDYHVIHTIPPSLRAEIIIEHAGHFFFQ